MCTCISPITINVCFLQDDSGSYSRFQNSKSISSDDYFGREPKGEGQLHQCGDTFACVIFVLGLVSSTTPCIVLSPPYHNIRLAKVTFNMLFVFHCWPTPHPSVLCYHDDACLFV